MYVHFKVVGSEERAVTLTCISYDGGLDIGQFVKGCINPPDLERLKLFGRRIRTLTFSECARAPGVVDSSAAVTIASALRGEYLFPNLQELEWDIKEDSNAALPLCISPGLRNVLIHMYYNDALDTTHADVVSAFVLSLAHSNIQLSDLKVDFPCSRSMMDIIPSAFSKLQSLQLCIDHGSERSFDLAFLQELTHLDQLDTLNLDCPFFRFHLPNGYPNLCFQHVGRLFITCPFDDVFNLLAITRFPSLFSFDLDFILPIDLLVTYDYDWKRLLDTIRDVASPSKVQEISLVPWQPSWSDNTFQYDFFRRSYPGVPFEDLAESLLRFKLVTFICNFPLFRSLTMENLKAIVSAWPTIAVLYLYTAEENTVGLDALHYLASNLPFLFNLAIGLDASVGSMSNTPARFGQSLEAFSLRLFRHTRSLSTVSKLASHVDALFPNVERYTEMADNWNDVKDEHGSMFTQLLDIIKQARKRERRRISAQ
ncbi:hypothetical protein CVT24_010764 [Panaeolus cyanescens]|uniref:F-box domain-containing protein n=1 Tax=Panaeolus cyanescens TaxID=181874 RepID=A0A409YM64_9AGAR|nr:hypothetical protein CVT24_010764 [Panaeolus cyanescens]